MDETKPMNHEGHEVSRRLQFRRFPSCGFVRFVVEFGKLTEYQSPTIRDPGLWKGGG
jgi:hypothetical protein